MHKYKGVTNRGVRFTARIVVAGQVVNLGSYQTEEEAARAVDAGLLNAGKQPVNFPVDTATPTRDTAPVPLTPEPNDTTETAVPPGDSARGQGNHSQGGGTNQGPDMADLQIVEWHPHALTYPLLDGDEYIDFRESIRAKGQRVPVLYRRKNGRVQGIDGRNRQRACKDLGINCRMEEIRVEDDGVIDLIDLLNLDRRHLTADQRKAKVADLRSNGHSTRTIAEKLGVSPATVRNDLADIEEAKASPGGQNCPPENKQGVENSADNHGCSDEPEPSQDNGKPKVKGKDGKTYDASKKPPLLCERCTRTGAVADCKGCAEARKKAGVDGHGRKPGATKPPKKAAPKPDLKDGLGNVIPEHLRDAFADPGLRQMVAEYEALESMFDPKKAVEKATGYADHYGFLLLSKFEEHIYQAKESLQLAAEALRVGVPVGLCPSCKGVNSANNGKSCKTCRGCGLVPQHRLEEATA